MLGQPPCPQPASSPRNSRDRSKIARELPGTWKYTVASDLNEQRWEWSDELDAVAAAPAHHHVLLENERVRVLETRIEPGDSTPVHTHRWPNVQYVLSSADFVRYDGDGRVTRDTRVSGPPQPAAALWSGPLPPHSLENVGETELRVIMIELKERAASNREQRD